MIKPRQGADEPPVPDLDDSLSLFPSEEGLVRQQERGQTARTGRRGSIWLTAAASLLAVLAISLVEIWSPVTDQTPRAPTHAAQPPVPPATRTARDPEPPVPHTDRSNPKADSLEAEPQPAVAEPVRPVRESVVADAVPATPLDAVPVPPALFAATPRTLVAPPPTAPDAPGVASADPPEAAALNASAVTAAPAANVTLERESLARAAIDDVLDTYRQAYGSLDAIGVSRIWQGLDTKSLQRAFDSLARQELSFDQCDVRLEDDEATAACTGLLEYVRKFGQPEPHQRRLSWRFELQRAGDRWLISNLEAR